MLTRLAPHKQKCAADRIGRTLHDLRISVTDQCNFRCPYCMPKEKVCENSFLKKQELLSFSEITRIANALAQLGVKKIRLTGGEPLLRSDIGRLIQSLRKINKIHDIALTTNGFFLAQKAKDLKAAGLDRITISLDSLDEDIFQKMNGGRGSVKQVLKGIDAATRAGFSPIKLNVMVQKSVNDTSLIELIEFFRGSPHILRFIEFMDVGTQNSWQASKVVPSVEVYRSIHQLYPLVALDANYPGEVASRYAFKDGKGEIGFISSISQPFCRDCSRLRLSPDGKLYTCLFASDGINLKSFLRDGATDKFLQEKISNLWGTREDRYSELRFFQDQQKNSKIEMYKIGG